MILETAAVTVSSLSYLPCLLVELHLLEFGLGFAFRSSSVKALSRNVIIQLS